MTITLQDVKLRFIMFSGIIEAQSLILTVFEQGDPDGESVQISIQRPSIFNDISIGDSVCVNGTCLTVEEFTSNWLKFTLGKETLKVSNWKKNIEFFKLGLKKSKNKLNLERSLRFGDRIHGHLVSGHVDESSEIIKIEDFGENRLIEISLPDELRTFISHKGSVTVNGVSLTVNRLTDKSFSVGLIPETLRQTNLSSLEIEDQLNLEVDYLSKILINNYSESIKKMKDQKAYTVLG